MKWFLIWIMILVGPGIAYAQIDDNRGYVWMVKGVAVLQDSIMIDPSSILPVDSSGIQPQISYDPVLGTIRVINANGSIPDSLEISYRRLPFPDTSYATMTLHSYDSAAPFKDYYSREKDITEKNQKLFETGNVSTNGRLSRGITVGNTRDLLINSSLNLTLDGQLSEDLNIRASITDQDIPYQPEGNTAQLQDFDNVFMQLYNDDFDISAGDIVLNNSGSRFLRYYKNVQGAQFNASAPKSSIQLGASLAKGKFASVQIEPIDGLVGPYRIPGPNGENFVIVLANSEKVFLDGKLLIRGFNNDFIIDYNLGEITFTSRIMITQYSRIRVDYEYADTQYNRSILTAGYEREVSGGSIYIGAYREMDNKNRPNFDLTQEDIGKLIIAGDDPTQAITSGSDSIGFDPNRIMYKKVESNNSEIFVYSINPDSAIYEVRFSNVGVNQGDYTKTTGTANGQVFEWIPRVDNIPQGEYEPYQIIASPSRKEMIVAGGNFEISEFESISFETAFSNNDKNRFSPYDSYDDIGGALNFEINSIGRPIGDSKYKIQSGLLVEHLSPYFTPIDRIRDVEFDRDWSYYPSPTDKYSNDDLVNLDVGVVKDRANRLNYGISRRIKGNLVNGFQQRLELNKQLGNFQLRSDFFTLNNLQQDLISRWNRLKTDLSYKIGTIRPGYVYSVDQNRVQKGDSLSASANYFNEHLFYLRSAEKRKGTAFDLGYGIREDYLPQNGRMVKNSLANTLNISFDQQISPTQRVNLMFIYRKVSYHEKVSDNDNSVSGRLDWSGSFLKNTISNEMTYTVANSRELRKEYIFIQVPAGEGSYNWIDENEDGIKDLGEFFPAIHSDEKNYAKIFIPTSDYVDAFENTFNYRFNLRFPMSWKKSIGMKKFLYRISNSTVWTSTSKTQDESAGARLLAFVKPINTSDLISLRENFRTTWFFNRTNSNYGINFSYKLNHFIDLLAGGIDERMIDGFDIVTRLNLGGTYSVKVTGNAQREYSMSELLPERNFVIQTNKVQPTLSWQRNKNFRFNLDYEFISRENIQNLEEQEFAHIHELAAEVRWSKVKKMNVQGQIKYAEVAFQGVERTPVGYAVLSGYRPGANISWLLTLQQTLIDGLQLSINYQGRHSEKSRIIHFGRVLVSALF